jgi:hypothetical protein
VPSPSLKFDATGFRLPLGPLIKQEPSADVWLRRADPEAEVYSLRPRRGRLWDLAASLHCTIIGTCLTNVELRRVLAKLKAVDAETTDEHELHVRGVTMAAQRDGGAKFLQKALDNCHAATIRHYAAAKDEASLLALWDESRRKGDIPGAYWAILTHPHATHAVIRKAFQDVHMLSHLVGAANRADIRRLRQLEDLSQKLADKVRRQQAQLQDGFRGRDEEIHRLGKMLTERVEQHIRGDEPADAESLRVAVADLGRRLGRETQRRQRLDQRVAALTAELKAANAARRMVDKERADLARELTAVEAELLHAIGPVTADAQLTDLAGRTILYVGGRIRHIRQLKSWVDGAGGQFLHHDGGVEHSPTVLPGLVSRADLVCFPIDCVSHDAVATVKRLCRQSGKSYMSLRTMSVAALISALTPPPVQDAEPASDDNGDDHGQIRIGFE